MLAEFDLRPEQLRHSHEQVMSKFAVLPVGESIRIILDHEPRPLRSRFGELYARSYVWTQRYLGGEFWEATIRRTSHRVQTSGEPEALFACSPLFADISTNARRVLAKAAIQKVMHSGTAVIEQGVSWPYFGIVATGSITAIVNTDAGRDYTLFEAWPTDIFGEIQGLDEGCTFARFVVTSRETTVFLIPRAAIINLADCDGRFARQLATLAAQRARLLGELLYARATKPTIARLSAILLPYGTQPDRMGKALPPLPSMTQVELARLVGTVKDVVGRDLAELRAAGALVLSGGRIIRAPR